MILRVTDDDVTAGEAIVGHVVNQKDSPVTVILVRNEQAGETRKRSEVARVVSAPGNGAFEVRVPRSAHPTVDGERVKVSWTVESGGDQSARLAITKIAVQRDPQATFSTFYSTGQPPQVNTEFTHRNHSSIYMGGIMFAFFAFGFFYIEQISRDDSTLGRPVMLGIILAVALISLATSLLAAATRWPRTISGFEPTLSPDVAERGGLVELVTSHPPPNGLRLLCIESYGEVVERGNNYEGFSDEKVMRQHTHPPIWPTPTSSGCSFQLPHDALPSVRCAAGDVMWVVRQGGKTLGPWGPFRHRDWGVVVR